MFTSQFEALRWKRSESVPHQLQRRAKKICIHVITGVIFCGDVVGDDGGCDFDVDPAQPFFDDDGGELFSQQVVDDDVDEQFSQPEEENKRPAQSAFVGQPKHHPLGNEQHNPRQTKKPMSRKKFYISYETPCRKFLIPPACIAIISGRITGYTNQPKSCTRMPALPTQQPTRRAGNRAFF